MISYPEARDLVRAALEPTWTDGTFWLDERLLVEDDELYLFRVGPREWLVDGDVTRARYGGGLPAVVKATGRLVWLPEIRAVLRTEALRIRPNPAG